MYMCIVMFMNIYIKPTNETMLRDYNGSMSGLVNRLLEEFFADYPSAATGTKKPKEYAELPTKYPLGESCKHGYSPKLCKFAPPGKSCK